MAPDAREGSASASTSTPARLNAALNQVALEDAYRDRLREMGAGTQAMTPGAQLDFMQAERKKWGDIARAANVEVV